MLIPYGQEHDAVRRDPWVAFGIILLNVVVAAPVFLGQPGREAGLREAFTRFREFVVEHPYLEVPPDLMPLVSSEALGKLARFRAQATEAGALPSEDALVRERQELRQRGDALLRARDAMPWSRWGFVPAQPSLLSALTSMWVHVGWLHLVGNMLFFFATGPFLEDVYGRVFFAAVYLASGLVAVATHAVYFAGSTTPLVGASGAVAGVMGAFLIRLGASRIKFLFLPLLVLPFFRITLLLPAFVVLPFWFLGQHWLARQAAAGDTVAYWAHVGGFAFGLVVAGLVRLARVEERFIQPGIEREVSIVRHPSLERAMDAHQRGDWTAARLEIRRALAAEPSSVDTWAEACDIALASGDARDLERCAPRLLELRSKGNESHLGVEFLQRVVREHPGLATPRLLLTGAAFHDRIGDGRGALEIYDRLIEVAPESEEAFLALVRSGEVLRRAGDVSRSRQAYERARAHRGCTGHWPARIDGALAGLAG